MCGCMSFFFGWCESISRWRKRSVRKYCGGARFFRGPWESGPRLTLLKGIACQSDAIQTEDPGLKPLLRCRLYRGLKPAATPKQTTGGDLCERTMGAR